jgi:hypothetical protein
LKELLPHYPYHHFLADAVILNSPYEPLILNWDLLWEEASKGGSGEKDRLARSDLKLLLETLKESSGDDKLDEYLKTRESLKNAHTITFDTLWTIFPPGTIVYGRPFLNKDQIFIVEDNKTPWPRRNRRRPDSGEYWTLDSWTYDWNGSIFQRRPIELGIERFEGPKPISALPYHPFSETKNRRDIEKKLLERGELFRKFCTRREGQQMFNYSGNAILDKKGFRGVQLSKVRG